ncbi:glycosyltransferase family 2 protein [Neptunitalea lumnitzerae]|uniref:Glycosyl transferase n=1 Tax=Neptunitalea lumnitzerae TaxID=2965509 RepID=A0ABQ5MKX6_9FLAO|nr:glycosyltransferase family 2 protein [Neptunitalea sp. Y10]GLB49961.1 glycosyl transferase [Neptunitalea sp. Y10]
MKHTVAIIVINYNTATYTIDCIKSILNKTDASINYQIIVIDNTSEVEDYLSLEQSIKALQNSKITLFRSCINTGFGGGNMQGVQFAHANYYAFVNNDTIFENDCISECLNFMENTPDAGICGPQILKSKTEQSHSFDHFISLGKLFLGSSAMEKLAGKPKRKINYTSPIKVDYVNGSFMFCNAEDFNNVGGFDTNIFLFYEESDLSYRLKKKGKFTYFLPSAKYIHYEGKSQKTSIKKKLELKTSMLYVMQKNNGYFSYLIARYFLLIRYFLTALVKPKYFPLAIGLFTGLPLSKSYRQEQKIIKLK